MTRPLRVRGARSGPGDVPPAGGGSGQSGPGPAFSQAVAMWRMRRKRRYGLEQQKGLDGVIQGDGYLASELEWPRLTAVTI